MISIVTGANGFIGKHLASSLKSRVLCDTSTTKMYSPDESLEILNDSGDVTAVYHLGAISSTTETDTSELAVNNIHFSCQLLEACILKEIPFVYASSASVYGLGDKGFNENVNMSPLNYYAISKASFDMFAMKKIEDNPNAQIVGLRYFNVYGSGENHKLDMASPVHKFLEQSKTGRIKIFEGSEGFLRDFIHVSDVVSITKAAKDFKNSGIYNVGTGVPRSFLDVAKIISNETGAEICEIPFPVHLIGKYQAYTCSDNEKIIDAGYNSKYLSLEEGVKRVINARIS